MATTDCLFELNDSITMINDSFNTYLHKTSEQHNISKQQAYDNFIAILKNTSHPSTKSSSLHDRTTLNPKDPITDKTKKNVSKFFPESASKEDLKKLSTPSCAELLNMDSADAVRAIDLILREGGKIEKHLIQAIHQVLFDQPANFTRFLTLHSSESDFQNQQFELFLQILDIDLMNENNKTWMPQLLNFAFSNTRFEWIQTKDEDISPNLHSNMLSYEKDVKSFNLSEHMFNFRHSNTSNYQKWLKLRIEGSNTIDNPTDEQQKAIQRWHAADTLMQTKVSQGTKFSFGLVQKLHKTLTQHESDVKNAGQIRHHVVKTGFALKIYPTNIQDLNELCESYSRWLDEQINLCLNGQKSIILTAAQAYQRLVSIHPFEGGNGRISRLVMDYVLERCGLPAAALGKDVLDGIFALEPKNRSAGEAFVKKIFNGVKTSYDMIHHSIPKNPEKL